MATKKKVAKKTIKSAAGKSGLRSIPNWIPFCVEIAHSQASAEPFTLSVTGDRFPNSVYFMYQSAVAGTLTLPLGYFVGHGQPGDAGTFQVSIDANGMTGVLVLNPYANVAMGGIRWSHQPARMVDPPGGGGIIIKG